MHTSLYQRSAADHRLGNARLMLQVMLCLWLSLQTFGLMHRVEHSVPCAANEATVSSPSLLLHHEAQSGSCLLLDALCSGDLHSVDRLEALVASYPHFYFKTTSIQTLCYPPNSFALVRAPPTSLV